eukprot:CAMPEP_0181113202 /NCGR_PEP_ID=MMETSP1071-20121207/20222_1 /TAXON_ID=35127 /ORGANISM="Thalassiosira sp., Strain NH16" /LENGTH=559 /DNA_ID=CAMNT_0023197225 /DNA_START=134 /DNA_END=1810 /DNA_ORIENTATION=+
MDTLESSSGSRDAIGAGSGVRRRPLNAPYTATSQIYGTNEEDSLLTSYSEEGRTGAQFHNMDRRRSSGFHPPWYRQPQNMILAVTLAWVGSVMYIASLAHAILRTHKETTHMMGSSMVDGDENFKQWLDSQGMSNKYGASASDEHVRQWLESRSKSYNTYGASGETNADFQQWLESQGNRYGASGETNADFQEWLESQGNKYGASGETRKDSQHRLKSQKNTVKYGSSSGVAGNGNAWEDWLEYLETEDKYKYGASQNSGGKHDVNVRFGNSDNANYQEWLEYQDKNSNKKFNANGVHGTSQQNVNNMAAPQKMGSSQSLTSQQSDVATSDSSISTIDWPLQGLAHASCTDSNGCSPSTNVTVLIVYGPEYHTHISEMAWNVATGVHTAFQSHIKHHPHTPLHGHIVFGHTSNVTFLEVMDADAVIIGSPVYNGNVHPDVQNWINYWHIDADLSNKFGGAFATAGGIHAGADGTIMSILRSMMVFQMMAVGGDSWTSPFGAVATMYEDPFGDTVRTSYFDSSCYLTEDDGRGGDHLVHPYFLRKAFGLGERIANVTVAW